MTTARQLIEQLSKLDPDTTVVFQYLTHEHTDYSIDEFEARAWELEYTNFGDQMTASINEWLADVEIEVEA
jgi:RNase P/RNase MRP subunit POP5